MDNHWIFHNRKKHMVEIQFIVQLTPPVVSAQVGSTGIHTAHYMQMTSVESE
jgi:hypothetical protein